MGSQNATSRRVWITVFNKEIYNGLVNPLPFLRFLNLREIQIFVFEAAYRTLSAKFCGSCGSSGDSSSSSKL